MTVYLVTMSESHENEPRGIATTEAKARALAEGLEWSGLTLDVILWRCVEGEEPESIGTLFGSGWQNS